MATAWQVPHGWMEGNIFKLKKEVKDRNGKVIAAGSLVRVTMCSRFLDCGINPDISDKTAERYSSYVTRVLPMDLEEVIEQIPTYKDPVVSEMDKKMYRVTKCVTQLPLVAFNEEMYK